MKTALTVHVLTSGTREVLFVTEGKHTTMFYIDYTTRKKHMKRVFRIEARKVWSDLTSKGWTRKEAA